MSWGPTEDGAIHYRWRYRPAEVEERWQQRWADEGSAPREILAETDKARLGPGRRPGAGCAGAHTYTTAPSAAHEPTANYGLDTWRLATLRGGAADPGQVEGCHRFLNRLWRLAATDPTHIPNMRTGKKAPFDNKLEALTIDYIEQVAKHHSHGKYNHAIAASMAFCNTLYKYVQAEAGPHERTLADAVDVLLRLLGPAVPHVTAELWAARHNGEHIHALGS